MIFWLKTFLPPFLFCAGRYFVQLVSFSLQTPSPNPFWSFFGRPPPPSLLVNFWLTLLPHLKEKKVERPNVKGKILLSWILYAKCAQTQIFRHVNPNPNPNIHSSIMLYFLGHLKKMTLLSRFWHFYPLKSEKRDIFALIFCLEGLVLQPRSKIPNISLF